MGVCEQIRTGYDMTCGNFSKKYYQQAVIVNRSDVLYKSITTPYVNIDGEYQCRYRVSFQLAEGATGHRFTLGENASSIYGLAEKSLENGIPSYNHTVNMVIMGVSEFSKCILSQFDNADYFVALQIGNEVEIFGFEYGLGTANYTYDPQRNGGTILKLTSLRDSPEDELPFIYVSGTEGGEITDFNNNFADNVFDINGDFNDDFNNDFNNQ